MGRKCEYKEFAELNRVYNINHVEKVYIEKRLELVKELVIKADTS